MKKILFIILLSISIQSFSQSIRDLEKELTSNNSSENQDQKISKAKNLLTLDPFNRIGIDFYCRYYEYRYVDSIDIYFSELQRKYPTSSKPLLLRVEFLWSEIDFKDYLRYDTRKVELLKKALSIEHRNSEVMYLLANVYYKDFLRPTYINPYADILGQTNEPKKSILDNSGDSALAYFKMIEKIDKRLSQIVYFPMQQLEYYKHRETKPSIDSLMGLEGNCFFPIWYFANLTARWYEDLSIDYQNALESSKSDADELQKQLMALEEPCLYDYKCSPNTEIYRFTWLRSFHHPIIIRVVKNANGIILSWKIGKGAAGYKPTGLKEAGKVETSESQWANLLKLVDKANFLTLPNRKYVMMYDGADWTLEYRTNTIFKAHLTNEPSEEFKECCLYLLRLSGIRVPKKDIY